MRRPRIRTLIRFLLLGAVGAAALPMVLTLAVDLTSVPPEVNSASTGSGTWSVTRWDRAGGVRLQSVRDKGRNWSVSQATGAPDTPTGGDQYTAWASASADATREWIVLDFATAVVPKAIHLYEMCSTGALDRIGIFNGDSEVIAWSGPDPLTARMTMGTADISVEGTFKTSRVKLYFNSPAVPGWNEVDAVGLEDVNGSVQWAVSAEASSEYGNSSYGSTDAGALAKSMPAWSGLQAEAIQIGKAPPVSEGQIIEARGWPLVSMAGHRRLDATWVNAAAQTSSYGGLTSFSGSRSMMSLGTPAPAAAVANSKVLPTRIVPIGFAVDSIFYAIVLAMLSWIASAPRRFFREAARVRSGHCVACGYDLRYDFVPGCPECGWNRNDAQREANGKAELKPSAFTSVG